MKYYDPLIYLVPATEDGAVLKNILQKRLGISRKLLSRLKMTEQGIMVNGVRQYISVKVNEGDRIEIYMEEEASTDILPEPLPLNIVYEDKHFLIVNKEAGMIVHPTHGHYTGTLANAVVHYWQCKEERYRFRPIHRLDQDTSGVLAIAKNPYAHQAVAAQMIANTVEKHYVAIVHGSLLAKEGTINAAIDRDEADPHRRVVVPSGQGYPAVTHYRVRRQERQAALVDLLLETGRTHQIRVHMRHLGHPLVGDKMYGDPERELRWPGVMNRHALHAERLSFRHPVSGEVLTFTAPLPADMQWQWAELTKLSPG